MNNAECKLARFMIDCQNQSQFIKLVKEIPSIFEIFQVFTKKQSESKKLVSQKYTEWLNKLEKFLSRNLTHQ